MEGIILYRGCIIDRTNENREPNNEIIVTLEDCSTVKFFISGLSDDEYIDRAQAIQKIELTRAKRVMEYCLDKLKRRGKQNA